MKTIADTFKAFKARACPRGMTEDQELQIKNAYFAGQVQMFSTINQLGDLTEDQAMEEIGKLKAEMNKHFDLAHQQAIHAFSRIGSTGSGTSNNRAGVKPCSRSKSNRNY